MRTQQRLYVVLIGLGVGLGLAGCMSEQGSECNTGGGCASTVAIPTSDVTARDSGTSSIEGVLGAETRNGDICLSVDSEPDHEKVNLVLPSGSRAIRLGELPSAGAISLRIIGNNGLGGIRTGSHVAVIVDDSATAPRPAGCITGSTVLVGWMATRNASR